MTVPLTLGGLLGLGGLVSLGLGSSLGLGNLLLTCQDSAAPAMTISAAVASEVNTQNRPVER